MKNNRSAYTVLIPAIDKYLKSQGCAYQSNFPEDLCCYGEKKEEINAEKFTEMLRHNDYSGIMVGLANLVMKTKGIISSDLKIDLVGLLYLFDKEFGEGSTELSFEKTSEGITTRIRYFKDDDVLGCTYTLDNGQIFCRSATVQAVFFNEIKMAIENIKEEIKSRGES